jgi:hypothetical protein
MQSPIAVVLEQTCRLGRETNVLLTEKSGHLYAYSVPAHQRMRWARSRGKRCHPVTLFKYRVFRYCKIPIAIAQMHRYLTSPLVHCRP